ncbi:MAG: PDZ domain-containing protein [Acidobacteriota bacterium]|nr:MAG: PDZ domain-containing protein [Acidobacteriota bacterium]
MSTTRKTSSSTSRGRKLAHCLCSVVIAASLSAVPAAAGEKDKSPDEEARIIVLKSPAAALQAADDVSSGVFFIGEDGEIEPGALGGHWIGLRAERGFLGVEILSLTPELLEHYGVDSAFGALVARVSPDTPAERAGLRVGDILTGADSEPFRSAEHLSASIAETEQGQRVEVDLWRDGRPQTISVTMASRPRAHFDFSRIVAGDLDPNRFLFKMDPEVLIRAQQRLEQTLEDPALEKRLELWAESQGGLEQRLREMEEKLRELQRKLERALSEAR